MMALWSWNQIPPPNVYLQAELGTRFMLVSCLAYPSTLNMDVKCSSETSVGFQQTTQHYIPADRTIHNIEFATAMSILTRLHTKRLLVVSNDQRTYSVTVYFQVNQPHLMPPTSKLQHPEVTCYHGLNKKRKEEKKKELICDYTENLHMTFPFSKLGAVMFEKLAATQLVKFSAI
jgi:hypothetical protein